MTTVRVLSHRASMMPASPIRRLAPLATAARRSGKTIHALNIGQPDTPTPREILDRMRHYEAANLPYGPSQGLPEFIETLRDYYSKLGIALAPEEIFVTTGGSEALLFVIGMIADPGDEIVVFEPFYANYAGFSSLVGVKLVPLDTHAEDGYHLPDRAAIEAKLSPRTRAILICSPNNPTGTVYSDREMETLAALCADRGLFLVADEVYREFVYDGRSHRSALTLRGIEQQVVVVDSLSKRASLCGARVGCVVSRNRELMSAILKCGQARLCPPTLGQYLACGLRDVSANYLRDVVAEFEQRRNAVHGALAALPGVTLRRPEGAFYLCPRLPIDDGQTFAEFLLRDFSLDGETVMIAPGDGFYVTPGLGNDQVRIAYVVELSRLRRAAEILAAALEAYPGRAPG